MTRQFYRLQGPEDDEEYRIYGQPIWLAQFGLAEWGSGMKFESIVCPSTPVHQRSGPRVMDLTIKLPSPRIADFVWTWYGECIVVDRVLDLLRRAGFTGFEARPVRVDRVKNLRKPTSFSAPVLWELKITGRGGDADARSGIRVIETCATCDMVQYSSFKHGIIVDEHNWDGSDFFTLNYPDYILVTERVKDFIIKERLVNCALVPSEELRWPDGVRPEDVLEERKALDALLGDLPGSLPILKVPQRHDLDNRIRRAQEITGTRIRRTWRELVWTPISNPPGSAESLAWAWVIRPDLSAMTAARTEGDLQMAMLKLGKYYEPL